MNWILIGSYFTEDVCVDIGKQKSHPDVSRWLLNLGLG